MAPTCASVSLHLQICKTISKNNFLHKQFLVNPRSDQKILFLAFKKFLTFFVQQKN